ncbi:MAG TPA: hypothetical protein VGH00_00670 [Chthoniobacterales bacterium]
MGRAATGIAVAELTASMLLITVEFEPHSFERSSVEQMTNDLRARLAGHEFARLTIVLRKDFRREIIMHFRGDEQEVAKARRILGAY